MECQLLALFCHCFLGITVLENTHFIKWSPNWLIWNALVVASTGVARQEQETVYRLGLVENESRDMCIYCVIDEAEVKFALTFICRAPCIHAWLRSTPAASLHCFNDTLNITNNVIRSKTMAASPVIEAWDNCCLICMRNVGLSSKSALALFFVFFVFPC